jgi:dUTP pyrophosphatase
LKVKVKRLYESAKLPTYATDGSVCFDIYTMLNGDTDYNAPHTYSTGLAFEIPEGHVMLIFSRSGHGFKNDVRLSNCVGVIDSDYRGELKVKLSCDKQGWGLEVNAGDRIAQGMVIPYKKVMFEEVGSLSETVRGDKGFGSSGS